MIDKDQKIIYNSVQELNISELKNISGGEGNAWYRFWKWVGKQVGSATIPNMETYDHEAELAALENYGAPY